MERASRDVWAKRVERWRDSGLTAKQFAAELDVSPNTLTFWKWKLGRLETTDAAPAHASRKRVTKREDAAAGFLQLVPTSSPQDPRGGDLEVVFTSGVIIRVPPDFDEPTLLRLARVLGGRL